MAQRLLIVTLGFLTSISVAQASRQPKLSPIECQSGRFAIQNPDGSLVGSFDFKAGSQMSFAKFGEMNLVFQDRLPDSRKSKLILSLNGQVVTRVSIRMVSEWSDAHEKLIYRRKSNTAVNLMELLSYAENYLARKCSNTYQTSGNAIREELSRESW